MAYLSIRLNASGLEHQTVQGFSRQSPQELLPQLLARWRFSVATSFGIDFLQPSLLFCVTNYCGKSKSSHPEGLKMISQELLCTTSLHGGIFLCDFLRLVT